MCTNVLLLITNALVARHGTVDDNVWEKYWILRRLCTHFFASFSRFKMNALIDGIVTTRYVNTEFSQFIDERQL